MDEITLVEIPAQNVIGTKKKGSYSLIPELLMKVYHYAMKQKAMITGPPIFLCHETSPEEVRKADENGTASIEIAWPVSGSVRGNRRIRTFDLPGGKMVRAVHRGPYAGCGPTYQRIFTWIGEQGLTINGPIREVYPNDPRTVKPADIITEVYVPVK